MKINIFRGELTDNPAKKEPLCSTAARAQHPKVGHLAFQTGGVDDDLQTTHGPFAPTRPCGTFRIEPRANFHSPR